METALSEITLVLFTTIAPAGAVGYMAMIVASFCSSDESAARRIERYLVVPLVFAISGLIASATHLGTPANALYVITGIGRSPLSNEVAAAVAFLAFGGVYWFLAFRDEVAPILRRILAVAVITAGVAFVSMIAFAYSVNTVPTWDLPTVPIMLCFAALASGPFVGFLGIEASGAGASGLFRRACLAVAAVSAAANLVVLVIEMGMLSGVATTVQAAKDLVPWFPGVAVAFALCEAAALVLAVLAPRFSLKGQEGGATGSATRAPGSVIVLSAAALLSLAGCFAVRFAFYAMHMTSGM